MDITTLGYPELEQKVFTYHKWALSVPPEQRVDFKRFWDVVSKPLPPEWIKQRKVGEDRNGRDIYVDYIEGGRVRQLLTEACGGPRWFFVPLTRELVTNVKRRVRNQAYDDSPYVAVLGCLVIPGIGAQVGYGAKTLEGGSSTQSTAMAAALTTALKAAAKEFGVALELYVEGEYDPMVDFDDHVVPEAVEGDEVAEEAEIVEAEELNPDLDQPREFVPPEEIEDSEGDVPWYEDEEEETLELDGIVWPAREVQKLLLFQKLLGIGDDPEEKDEKMQPLINDWSKGRLNSLDDITPDNIASFNQYLLRALRLTEEELEAELAEAV